MQVAELVELVFLVAVWLGLFADMGKEELGEGGRICHWCLYVLLCVLCVGIRDCPWLLI